MIPGDNYVKPIQPKPVVKPEQKPKQQTQPQPQTTVAFKQGEPQYVGATNKYNLDKKYDATLPTPYKALEQINDLPKPDPNDKAAVEKYKQQRKAIADDAINNSKPPKIEDYRRSGLNGATANYEYQQAKQSYDSQIRQLKTISDEATRNPSAIITTKQAAQDIDKLPRPDRSDPQAVREYNNKRAQIANDALLYAKPPKRKDYKDNSEYKQARAEYDTTVKRLREDSQAAGSQTPPPITDAEADKAANDYIKNHNGVKNEDDAYAVGKDLADLAKTNPKDAAAIMKKAQEKLNGTAFGDNVTSGFVDSASDADLERVAKLPGGVELIKDLQHRLLSGDVHDGERDEAKRLSNTLTPLTSTLR